MQARTASISKKDVKLGGGKEAKCWWNGGMPGKLEYTETGCCMVNLPGSPLVGKVSQIKVIDKIVFLFRHSKYFVVCHGGHFGD